MHGLPGGWRLAVIAALACGYLTAGALARETPSPAYVQALSGAVALLALMAFPYGRLGGASVALAIVLVAQAALILAPDALALALGRPRPIQPGAEPLLRAALCLLVASATAHAILLHAALVARPGASPAT